MGFVTLIALGLAMLSIDPAWAQPQYQSVYLEDMTWPEIQQRLQQGHTTIIVPTGGTEQNGPHLAVGKHNAIVTFTAGEIARGLGNALVAPTIAYVPEGRISPPEGHMRFPGTISISELNFAGLIEDTALSLKQHGFTTIALIGDHGGSQETLQRVAEKLNAKWRTTPYQILHLSNYYAENGQAEWIAKQHPGMLDPQAHAGFADTSELLATDKRLVRESLIQPYNPKEIQNHGVGGDPSKASTQQGITLLQMKIDAAIRQLRAMSR